MNSPSHTIPSHQQYLLEKSRVCGQAAGERAFHVLYDVLAASSSGLLPRSLSLGPPESYTYLANSSGNNEPGSVANFRAVRNALTSIGAGELAQQEIFSLLAAVLTLGNIGFFSETTVEGDRSRVSTNGSLATAASHLGVSPQALESLLTERSTDTQEGLWRRWI